jgi:hypothetical protein
MPVTITVGPDAEQQLAGMQNATLQDAGPVTFSIATHVEVPTEIAAAGPERVAEFLHGALPLCRTPVVSFDVQVGWTEGDQPRRCERCAGTWGADPACARCTNAVGEPRDPAHPGPMPCDD